MEWRNTFRARDPTIRSLRSSRSPRRSCRPLMGNVQWQYFHQPIFCRPILYPRRPAHDYQRQLPVHKPQRREPAIRHHDHSRLNQHHIHFQRRHPQLDKPTLHRRQSQILQIARQPRRQLSGVVSVPRPRGVARFVCSSPSCRQTLRGSQPAELVFDLVDWYCGYFDQRGNAEHVECAVWRSFAASVHVSAAFFLLCVVELSCCEYAGAILFGAVI
jgi:hypothetical protein